MLARLQPGLVLSDFIESGRIRQLHAWRQIAGDGGMPGKLFASHAQGVGNAIDVVKPGCDECDLQDCLIVKSRGAQAIMIIFPDFGSVFGKFDYVVQHDALLLGDGSGRVVPLQRFDESFIQRYSTQKLCV